MAILHTVLLFSQNSNYFTFLHLFYLKRFELPDDIALIYIWRKINIKFRLYDLRD